MTDFKNSKSMYCTPMDVRNLYSVFERTVEDDSDILTVEQAVTDAKIEQYISDADALILGYLIGPYGGESALIGETPYFKGPITPSGNSSTIALRGVIVASTAVTEQWLVKFTAEDTFTVTGGISGGQSTGGDGDISTNFTSDNSDIQIMAEDWVLGDDSAVDIGNQVIFSTYTTHPLVRTLSAKLAAADLISANYHTLKGEDPEYAKQLRRTAIDMLKALVDGNSDVSLNSTTAEDIVTVAVSWDINQHGSDVTDYNGYDENNPMDI